MPDCKRTARLEDHSTAKSSSHLKMEPQRLGNQPEEDAADVSALTANAWADPTLAGSAIREKNCPDDFAIITRHGTLHVDWREQ
jgi:hypothetical protein